jgi:hypothetical protein
MKFPIGTRRRKRDVVADAAIAAQLIALELNVTQSTHGARESGEPLARGRQYREELCFRARSFASHSCPQLRGERRTPLRDT